MIIASKVPQKYSGFSLHSYLGSRFTYLSGREWQDRISQGRILLNSNTCLGHETVYVNDTIAYNMPEFKEPPANLAYSIVHEDDWLLGIDKPGNLLVHHQGKSLTSNLIYHLRNKHIPPFADAGVVNRLDRETSGIVLVAKTKESLKRFNFLLRERKIHKEYIALVHGIPNPAEGTIDLPIGKNESSLISYRFCVHGKNPKQALTQYKTIDTITKDYTLLNLFPFTGRTHQLRVHLHSIGHTIVGDKLYGMTDQEFVAWRKDPQTFNLSQNIDFSRQALHCSRLSFNHPFTGQKCVISTPFPSDIAKYIDSKKC